jgi:hypothetical protein
MWAGLGQLPRLLFNGRYCSTLLTEILAYPKVAAHTSPPEERNRTHVENINNFVSMECVTWRSLVNSVNLL